MLKRLACFLRVTNKGSTWDGLDMPFDEPDAAEKLYAYELAEFVGTAHINMGRGRGGFYPIARYRLVPNQPSDAQMRTTKAWQAWCADQPSSSVPLPTNVPLY